MPTRVGSAPIALAIGADIGFKDWLAKGKKAAAENKDAVKDGTDKAGDVIDDKTGGKHAEHVDEGQNAAKDVIEELPGE